MYIIPGYVRIKESNSGIIIESDLLKNKVRIIDDSYKAEMHAIMKDGGSYNINTPLTCFLHEQELLLLPSEVDMSLEQLKTRLNEMLMLTIMPTEGCNFRCSYCYEKHSAISMSRAVLEAIQKYIVEQIPSFKKVTVGWFGGEPLLCKDIVLETALLVQSVCQLNGVKYSSNMTTNGYLLDGILFQKLHAVGITNYQVTLDGWIHDENRPHILGGGTLQTIIHNLIDISDLPKDKFDFRITLRHNILAGDEDFSWYDYLYNLFGHDDRFSVLVQAVEDWGGETVHKLNLMNRSNSRELIAKHLAYLDKIGMSYCNLEGGVFSQICYASYPHSMVFRPNGEIDKYTVALYNKNNCVGQIDPINGLTWNSELNRKWSTSRLKQNCYTCNRVLSCLNLRCRKPFVIDGSIESLMC